MPIDSPAPAVVNALRHAGYDLRAIPATPERVLAARLPRRTGRRRAAPTETAARHEPAAPRVDRALHLNGVGRRVRVPPMARLLDVLREECGLTGTKEGCGEGECGACTVLVDGAAVDACLVPVAHAEGTHVTTIEGAGRRRAGRALQRSFEAHGAAQCGICTPGMIVAAMPIPRGAAPPAITAALAGNLCRCTGYASIFRAVEEAARAAAAARRTVPGRPPVAARRSRLTLARPRTPARRAAPAGRRAARADRRLHRRLRRPAVRRGGGHAVPRSVGPRRTARHPPPPAGGVRLGALTTYTEICALAPGAGAGADARRRGRRDRRRADPESRHHRRQPRQRVAGRRHAAGAGGRRCPRRAAERDRRARGAALRVLHRLSAQRPAARRADRGDRDSARSTAGNGGARWARGGPRRSRR